VEPLIQSFYHPPSSTMTYVICDPTSKNAAIIDPALDFDLSSGKISMQSSDEIIDYVNTNGLIVHWILETHAHADHLTSAQYLQQKLGGKIAIGQGIQFVQETFKPIFNLPDSFAIDGSQFDKLLSDGDTLPLGDLSIKVMATPGHTNDSMTFIAGNNAFIGDTLFMPDSGTARCDFPGGNAAILFDSIQKIYALGDDTVLWICHDYQPEGRQLAFKTTVAEQKSANIHLTETTEKQQFVGVREGRDTNLAVPKLLYPSVQVNIQAGHLPEPQNNQAIYVKTPIIG
jgi:glyoxylase-like metal-dependent hydrolase (beta-lactamase superfamily II)